MRSPADPAGPMDGEVEIEISGDADLVTARAEGRGLAERLGFSRTEATLIATAISEIARNIVVHVGQGDMTMHARQEELRCGLTVVARDAGRGIRDVEAAVRDGVTFGGGLGLGL